MDAKLGPVPGLDRQIFYWINGWPEFFAPLFAFLSDATKIWPGRILLALVLAYCLWQPKLRTPALIGVLCFPIANEICDILKNGLQMKRPCVELADAIVRGKALTSYGTASAHSANMACIAAAFLGFDRRWGVAWAVVAVLTGLSRIYNGVHYPSQVLFGWAVGAAVGLLAVWIVRRVQARRARVAAETVEPGPSDGAAQG